MKIINIYLICINIISLIIMGWDKNQAIKSKRRISEHTLLTITFFGGSIGTLLGMLLFRHKIRNIKFIILVPLAIVINTLIYINII